MGSTMDSRYWTCPSCCVQFDWNSKTSNPADHDSRKCAQSVPQQGKQQRQVQSKSTRNITRPK